MSLDRRRALMGGGKKARLPANFQEVEWVGSSGVTGATDFPYISPGVRLVTYDIITIHFKPIAFSKECAIIGQHIQPQMELFYSDPNDFTKVKDYLSPHLTSFTHGNPYDIIVGTGSDRSANVYDVGYFNSKYPADYKVFYLEHHSNTGKPKLELIPCYEKSTGIIGMYDMVSGTFFANAGTGAFVKGADM